MTTTTHDHTTHGAHVDHAATDMAPHRHIGELIAMVERAPLSPWVRERAVRAFELLGEAEGRVHGMPADEVALHEVGAVDALIDIVGAIEGFEQLGVTGSTTGPSASVSGWVRASHGVIPVPAPATAILLEGHRDRPQRPGLGRGRDADRGRAAPGAFGGPAARPLAGGGEAEPGARAAAIPTEYPNALRLIMARAGGRSRRGGGALDRPGRSEPRVSGAAARGARERPARWTSRSGPLR